MGEEEIDLTRTKRGETNTSAEPGTEDDAPADPNIGPPIEPNGESETEPQPADELDVP